MGCPSLMWSRRNSAMSRFDSMSEAELEELRKQIEEFDDIQEISDELRALIEKKWPHLVAKLPPKRPSN